MSTEQATPELDIEPILAIHREPGNYIGFERKDSAGKHEQLFSIKASELSSMFPAIAKHLLNDSYFTVCGYYRGAYWKSKTEPNLPGVERREKSLKTLTACYSDIDCGRIDSTEPGGSMDATLARQELERLAAAGYIPQPSITAMSGRGCYAFWLLRDAREPEKLPKAYPEKVELYKQINRALGARLRQKSLPADNNATDAARILRTPGSVHRKANKRVAYVIYLQDSGKGFTYTLPELSEYLGIAATGGELPDSARKNLKASKYRSRKTLKPGSKPRAAAGRISLNAMRCQDLRTLEQHRGGWRRRGVLYPDKTVSPGRKFLLRLYTNFLYGCNTPENEAIAAVEAMAANCQPSWPDEGGDPWPAQLVKEHYAGKICYPWTNKKLCSTLGISTELGDELQLETIITPELRQARREALPTQQELIQERRRLAERYIETRQSRKPISCRELQSFYAANGIKISHTIASGDLNYLGIQRQQAPAKRSFINQAMLALEQQPTGEI